MPCTGRWAEAWQFAGFWCVDQVLTGTHGGAGPADVALVDTQKNFVSVRDNVGMEIENLTQGTSGPITAHTQTTVTATGVTWNADDSYRLPLLTAVERDAIELYLNVAAGDIAAALSATGACDCTLAQWAENQDGQIGFLAKLNIIDAASYYQCPCGQPRLNDDMQANYLAWMSEQLEMLMVGKLDVCDGATGADFPSRGWAEQGITDFQSARIVWNDILRNT